MTETSRIRRLLTHLLVGTALLQGPGLANAQGDEIPPRPTVIEIPDMQQEVAVAQGEPMIAKARVYVFAGLKLLRTIDAKQRGGSGAGRPTVTIEPQYLVARTEDSKWTYYAGNVVYKNAGVTDMTGELGSGGLQNRVGGLRVRKDDPDDIEIWVRRHRGRGFFTEEPFELEDATIGAGDDLSEAKELAFGGMNGDMLELIYREHAGTSPEPVLEETLSIDIADSPTVSVKGARFEVLEASAGKLRYRVLQNFE